MKKSRYQYGSYSESLQSYVFFNCRKRPPVNRAPQVTLRNLQPAGTWIGSGSCNSHLALFTTERQRELLPAVTFSKICLKQRTVETEGNFMKLNWIYTINLFGTSLIYYFVSIYFNNLFPLLCFKRPQICNCPKSDACLYEHFWPQWPRKSYYAVMSISPESPCIVLKEWTLFCIQNTVNRFDFRNLCWTASVV
jgi:hypothetical protein